MKLHLFNLKYTILAIFSIAFQFQLFAQTSKSLEINYVIKFLPDSNVKYYSLEMGQLLIGADQSLFASRGKLISDSISYQGLDELDFEGVSKHKFVIFKDFGTGKIKHFEEFLVHTGWFTYEESMSDMKWVIKTDTMIVNGFSCQKAELNYGNRDWTAWFTLDIPISDGPYKFSGLPGLIVKMYDKNNSWDFALKSIKELEVPKKIDLSYLPKPDLVAKRKFFENKRYFRDNVSSIRKANNSVIIKMDNDAGGRKLEKNTNEYIKRDNNWIELLK